MNQVQLQSWGFWIDCVFWTYIVFLAPVKVGRTERVVSSKALVTNICRVREREKFVGRGAAINSLKVDGDGVP